MIISDHKQFMFLHNPKSAGTSIRRALFEYDTNPLKLEYQVYIPGLERVIELFHVCAADIPHVWQSDWDSYFKFGFVRDPYTRLASSWDEYRRQHPNDVDPNTDFNEWAPRHLTRANIRYDWRYTHFCPQHYFFYQGRKCFADFIGRQETLDRDWKTACRLLRIPHVELGHNKDYNTYKLPTRISIETLSEEVLALVNDLYEMDFVWFGYQMAGPAPDRSTHLHKIESNTHPLTEYQKDEDVRLFTLTDQLGYWRARCDRAEEELAVRAERKL